MSSGEVERRHEFQRKADQLWELLATMPVATKSDPHADIAALEDLILRYPDAARRIIYLIQDGRAD